MVITNNVYSKEVKCVVWDLDNTLWDGVLLEDKEVKLKPGIANILKTIDSRGILNSIASKNHFDDAIGKLNEFGIKEYFLYPEINWNSKSLSIANIQKNLNIGMNTILFIDDQKFERDEVNFYHKEVESLDAENYLKIVEWPRLNPKILTVDSTRRRLMYIEDMKRKKEEYTFQGTADEFLATLDLEFIISKASEDDLKRAEELTIRTHQLNSTGVTYSYDELLHFCNSKDHNLLICELIDRYGSYGKIGLALVEKKDMFEHLKLLLMSCRVMSRGVGTVLLSYIMQNSKKRGVKLLADFMKTDKNRQMYIAYKFNNFTEIKEDGNFITFENDLSFIPQFPSYIKMTINN